MDGADEDMQMRTGGTVYKDDVDQEQLTAIVQVVTDVTGI